MRKVDKEATKKMSKYYFEVTVRERQRGFADDDEYKSIPYETFVEAYKTLVSFKPHRYWRFLRYISEMRIWLDGHSKVNVSTCGSYRIQLKDLIHLETTEAEFDDIIASIDNE